MEDYHFSLGYVIYYIYSSLLYAYIFVIKLKSKMTCLLSFSTVNQIRQSSVISISSSIIHITSNRRSIFYYEIRDINHHEWQNDLPVRILQIYPVKPFNKRRYNP